MLKRSYIMLFCLICLPLCPGYAHSLHLQVDDKVIDFEIVSNSIQYKTRWIDILIKETDFSVDNLKSLMKHFFEKYPTPERLDVSVKTNRVQFAIAHYVDPKQDPALKHPSAGLYRRNGNEFIRYRVPNEKLKTIVIKGKVE